MKKLFLTSIAALFLATGTAHAANRLKAPEILGHWCGSEGDVNDITVFSALSNLYVTPEKAELKKQIEECGARILQFKPNRYEGWEHGCRYLSVREWDDRSKVYATRTNRGAPTAEIVAVCSGEGYTWRERLVVYWSKGTLYVRSKRIQPAITEVTEGDPDEPKPAHSALPPEYKACHAGNAAACKRWRVRACRDGNPAARDYDQAQKQSNPHEWCGQRYPNSPSQYRFCLNGSPNR